MKLLERAGIVLASLALSFGLIALLSGFFQSRDTGQLAGVTSGPGLRFRDLGARSIAPGQLRPAYDSSPPTSGAHVPRLPIRDDVRLSDDQLLSALAAGDVVIMYRPPGPPEALVALARSVAGPFTPSLVAAGQAVILSPRPRLDGFLGLAWTHMIRVRNPDDQRLAQFAAYWLGRGAPRSDFRTTAPSRPPSSG